MRVVLIGAGNVGFHLGRRLYECGVKVTQVFSQTKEKAGRLAKLIKAVPTNDLNEIRTSADLYLLAVHDDAIWEVGGQLASLGLKDQLIAHTSGATPMTVFETSGLRRFGVFYPLQTFSIAREPDFSRIPICVDANGEEDLAFLENLALSLGPKAYRLTDAQRAAVHVAAVFVNNFSNHLFHIGKSILDRENLPFELLLPLIQETAAKLKTGDPITMQTGPAIRGDEATIRRHLEFLKDLPLYAEIYRLITQSIQNKDD